MSTQVRGVARAVHVEVEDAVGLEGRAGHAHDAPQGLVQLGRPVELARTSALLRDLLERVSGRVRPNSQRALVLELVDTVAQLCELGQRLAEPSLLADQGPVHCEDESGVAQARGEGRLPRRETRGCGLRDGQQGGERRHPQGQGQRLGHRHARQEERHERPRRPSVGTDDLADAVHGEGEESVEGERLRLAPALEAREQRATRDSQAETEGGHELEPRRAPGAEGPGEGGEAQEQGEGERHLARAPAHPDVDEGSRVQTRGKGGCLLAVGGGPAQTTASPSRPRTSA